MRTVDDGHCLQCGYALTGLPVVGHCPECGSHYNWMTGAGFANEAASRQARLDLLLARIRTGCLASLGVLALLCAGVSAVTGAGDPAKAFAMGAVFAIFFGLAALLSHVCEKPDQ